MSPASGSEMWLNCVAPGTWMCCSANCSLTGLKQKALCHFRWNCLPYPQRALLGHAGLPGHFCRLHFVLCDTIHSGSTPESRVIKQIKPVFWFRNTPSCLSFTLEFGPAKMNSCIWRLFGGKSKGWGDLESALCLLSQSVPERHYSALGVR